MNVLLHHATPEGCHIGAVSSEDCQDLCYMEWSVRVGRSQEVGDRENWEMAHLLEHVLGSLTSRKYESEEKLNQEMDQRAIYSNASVTDHLTTYWLKGPRSLASRMLDILLCAWMEFQLEGNEKINKEIKAVINELTRDEDDEWCVMTDKLRSSSFNLVPVKLRKQRLVEDSPLKIAECMWNFKRRWYRPEFSSLLLIGRDMKCLWQHSVDRLTTWSSSFPKPKPIRVTETKGNPGDTIYRIRVANVQHVKILYCIQGSLVALTDPLRHAFKALAMALGSGFSSRLMKRLRSQLAIVYDVSAECEFHPYRADQSVMIIETLLQEKDIPVVFSTISHALEELAHGGLRQDEIERWQNRQKSIIAHQSVVKGDLDMLSRRWGKWIHWGCYPDDHVPVTRDSVNIACKRLLGPTHRINVLIGGNFPPLFARPDAS